VLRQVIGDAEIMAGQLGYLLEATVVLLKFGHGV
jgi:hypothetical protein